MESLLAACLFIHQSLATNAYPPIPFPSAHTLRDYASLLPSHLLIPSARLPLQEEKTLKITTAFASRPLKVPLLVIAWRDRRMFQFGLSSSLLQVRPHGKTHTIIIRPTTPEQKFGRSRPRCCDPRVPREMKEPDGRARRCHLGLNLAASFPPPPLLPVPACPPSSLKPAPPPPCPQLCLRLEDNQARLS